MKIIGSLTSPFSRIVRTVCEELQLSYELDVTAPYGKLNPEQEQLINSHNPLMKVPVLVDGDEIVLDSRVIITYLLREHQAPESFSAKMPLSIAQENRLSTVYGIQDAGVLRFILSREGFALDKGYLNRSLERIHSGLAFLDKDQDLGKNFGLCELALICCLDWFTKRQIVDWKVYAHLQQVHAQYSDRPSLVKTRIPADL